MAGMVAAGPQSLPLSTRRMKPFKGARCGRAAWPALSGKCRADWLGTRQRGTCRSAAGARLSLIGRLRKRSSSDASPLRTSGRGSGSGRGREGKRGGKIEVAGAGVGRGERSEARRGSRARAGAGAGAGFDSTVRPSCFPPAQSLLSVRPSPPSASLSWSACHSAQQQQQREID